MTENENKVLEEDQKDTGVEETQENTGDGTEETPDAPNPMEELQQQLDESKSKYMYLLSDFENFKRNTAKERMELISTAGRDIMAALLPILDDFDRADKMNEGIARRHFPYPQQTQNYTGGQRPEVCWHQSR
ncbi:MAG: nucleotide exchange factor GrpE [Saprospiraceae bacterium]